MKSRPLRGARLAAKAAATHAKAAFAACPLWSPARGGQNTSLPIRGEGWGGADLTACPAVETTATLRNGAFAAYPLL